MSDEDYDHGFAEGYYQGLSTDKEKSFLILAARIDELKKENEKLRAALKPFADCEVWEGYKGYERFVAGMFHIHNKGMDSLNISHIRAARAAYLGENKL
jgi:hypothetical protein